MKNNALSRTLLIIFSGAVELKDLENGLSTTKEHQQSLDVWDIPKEHLKSDSSNAKSRRNCWVSNDHAQSCEPNTTTAVKTPKKVNFRSVEEVIMYKNVFQCYPLEFLLINSIFDSYDTKICFLKHL